MILTPDNYPGFYADLATLPPVWKLTSNGDKQANHFIVRPGQLVMEPVSPSEAYEFIHSGEYDERLVEIGEAE